MSNPILTTTNSKLDTRVKEPSGVRSPPGPGSPDRFSQNNKTIIFRLLLKSLRLTNHF